MEHLLGITGITFAFAINMYLILRYPSIKIAILAAFLIRTGTALFHFYVAPLPYGTADAAGFEQKAWEWASGGLSGVLEQFRGPHSHFISFIIGIVYAITDRSMLLAQSLSIMAGTGSVFLCWRLAKELWGDNAASKAIWLAALFPPLIFFSSITMREPYIVFFMLAGLIEVVRWARHGGIRPIVLGLAAFIGATFFHGAMLIAVLTFIGIVMARESQKILGLMIRLRTKRTSILIVSIFFVIVIVWILADFNLGKLGSPSEMADPSRWLKVSEARFKGDAVYPDIANPSAPKEILLTLPLKILYFLFSPFPWDIRSPAHFVGLIDGLMYMVLALLFVKNFRTIWNDPAARAVLLVLLPLILAFTLGTSNFGTALRHRSKFVVALIVLVSPVIPRLVVYKSTCLSTVKADGELRSSLDRRNTVKTTKTGDIR
jgi:hypothetical protein